MSLRYRSPLALYSIGDAETYLDYIPLLLQHLYLLQARGYLVKGHVVLKRRRHYITPGLTDLYFHISASQGTM